MRPEALGGFAQEQREVNTRVEGYQPEALPEAVEEADPKDRFAAIVERFEGVQGYDYAEDRRDHTGQGYITKRVTVNNIELVLHVEIHFDTTKGKTPRHISVTWRDPVSERGFMYNETIAANELNNPTEKTQRTLALLEESAVGAESLLGVKV